MKKKHKIKFTFFIAFSILFSCRQAEKGNVSRNVDYKEYQQIIEMAELSILNEDYYSAINSYHESQKYLNIFLGVDCYNALISSIKIRNWREVNFWAQKLVQKGVNLNFFSQEIFDEFRLSDTWDEFEKEYTKSLKKFQMTFKPNLKTMLEEMIDADQQLYCQIPTDTDIHTIKNSSDLEIKFFKLLENRELFSEEEIGLNVLNDQQISFSPIYYVLLRHSFQNGNPLVNKYLSSGVLSGIIKSEFEQLVKMTPFDEDVYVFDNGNYYQLKNSNIPDIYKRKIEYNHFSKEKMFLFFAPYNEIEITNKENEQVLNLFERVSLN